MNGNEMLKKLGRLSEITSMKDVRQLTTAMFPGTHCPLMGAAMAVRGIQDAYMLLVGTDECAYYTKHMTLYSQDFGGVDGRCLSVVLDAQNVTFGCAAKMEEAFDELVREYHPKAVFLVTTCIPELIGDDMDAIAGGLSQQYDIPVMAVHTEHFKCDNHLPGLERTITACLGLMEPQEVDGSVNLLGQRMGRFDTTELCHVLKDAGVEIGMQLPCGCAVEEIRRGPRAKVNIVVNDIAMPLAKKMQRCFGTPYVFFDKYTDPDRILAAYQRLFSYLELPLPEELQEKYTVAKAAMERGREKLRGVTYIYGNTTFHPFEFNRFMVETGMVPQIIQLSRFTEEDQGDLNGILQHCDPYVTKSANIAPLQYIYDVLKPQIYLGHEYAARLRKKGIAMAHLDRATSMMGFEITDFVVDELTRAAEEAQALCSGEMPAGHPGMGGPMGMMGGHPGMAQNQSSDGKKVQS